MPYKQNDILYYVLQYNTYSLKIFFHGHYTELASTMFSYAQQNGRNWSAKSPILVGNFAQIGLQKDTYCRERGNKTGFGGLSLTLEWGIILNVFSHNWPLECYFSVSYSLYRFMTSFICFVGTLIFIFVLSCVLRNPCTHRASSPEAVSLRRNRGRRR